MTKSGEEDRNEYASLTSWARDAEKTGQQCWVGAMIAALTILAWGAVSQSSALMLPVVLAVAAGFYAKIRGRQQVCSIAAYVEECTEGRGSEPSWLARLARFRDVQGFSPAGDWIAACLANGVALLAIIFAWLFAEVAWRGELMSGVVTACGIVFAFHSISETSRLSRPDVTSSWQRSSAGSRGAPRRDRAVGE